MLEQIVVEELSSDLAARYLTAPDFAFDIETDTSDTHWPKNSNRGLSYVADITHISFYSEGLPALVLAASWREIQYEYEAFNIETEEFEQRIGTRLQFTFSNADAAFIRAMFFNEKPRIAVAHNAVFDARQILGKFQIPISPNLTIWDTQAIQILGAWSQTDMLDDEDDSDGGYEAVQRSLSLYNLTAHWLTEEERDWWSGFKGNRSNLTKMITDPKRKASAKITDDEIALYVAVDSVMAYYLYKWQQNEINEKGFAAANNMDSLSDLLKIDLDYIKLCVEMAVVGVAANIDYLKEELVKYTRLWKASLRNLGLTVANEHLFRNKTWQRDYIFSIIDPITDKDLIETYKLKTKTGAWSFNKVALAYYMESHDELLLYRYHADLETKIENINTFLKHSEYDGRIHSIYSRHTVTGRNSSSLPNMQNLMMKRKRKYDKDLKAKYQIEEPGIDAGYAVADDGYVLISLDCSNAENWIGAMYARDDDFALACAQEDFHTVMASTAYFVDVWDSLTDKEKSDYRNNGKTITFGTSYGMGVKKLARELKVSLAEAKAFLENKDRTFWRVKKAKDTSSAFGSQNGYTILWTGRRIKLRSFNGIVKGYTAWNSLAQGGVGELIVRGMLQCDALLKAKFNSMIRIVGQVHDEIVFQIHIDDYYALLTPIIKILAHVIPDVWNERTTPKARWLFTLDNIENEHKWGYNPYVDYLLPLDEYVNEWGHHKYNGLTEAPTWINQWGYGQTALNKELGKDDQSFDMGESISVSSDAFDWNTLQQTLANANSVLAAPYTINDQIFVFPNSLHAARAAYHKGLDNAYLQYLEALDKLSEVIDKYNEWKQQ